MTAVFAVRHPQTTWNAAQRYQGRLEAPWSAEGRTQAGLLVRAFSGCDLSAVYSSPLSRSLDLARDLARATDAPLLIDERLTEIGLGEWEGLYRHEIEARYPDIYNEWYTRPQSVRFPGGETLHDVAMRAQSALSDVLDRFPSGEVALITHSVVVQVLAAAALQLPLQAVHRLRITNASITTLCGIELPASLLSLNDTSVIYRSPLAAAAAEDCVSWRERRMTA